MATSTYTGKLTDFAEAPFPNAQPQLTVRPKRDAFGQVGLMSARRIPVTVASDGGFSFQLTPSASVTPPMSYILRCEWFGDGSSLGYSEWEFTALLGGGNVKDMGVVDSAGMYRDAVSQMLPPLVDAELNARPIMLSVPTDSDPRSSRPSVSVSFRDRTRNVMYPSVYPAIYPGVSWTELGRRSSDVPLLMASGRLDPSVIPEIAPGVLTGLTVRATPTGPVVFEVRPDGKTWINDAVIASGGGGSGTATKRVVIIAALGQSNQVAHGQPVVPLLDGESSRIWQLPDGATVLTPAVVPLTMPGGTATGLSPSHVLARELVHEDPDCTVVIVPAAKGGSGLVTDPSMGYGKWAIDYTGPNPALYSNAVSAMNTAVAQVSSRWGVTPSVVTTWIQGEADGADGITRAAYESALDALINDWVGRFGGAFLLAGLVPQAATSGTRPQIVLGLQDTPRRVQKTAFVAGVDNGGGARGTSDVIHYGREAVEKIGRAWFEAIPRASNNVTGSYTTPPVTVTASKWGSEVTVDWSYPYCRVSSFEVQSSPDGTTWSPVTLPEPVATRATFSSSVPVKVRVRTVGTESSNWTAPVNAIGA